MEADRDRLVRLLGGDDLGWLVERVRWRLERGRPLDGSVTLVGATAEQRAAVHRLLGRKPRPGIALTVPLAAVDEVLRRSGACAGGLAAAVRTLTGEVTDRAAAAAASERDWRQAVAPLDGVVAAHPELTGWRDQLLAGGLLRRLARTPDGAALLTARLAAVVSYLPAGGEPFGRFAAAVTGDPHALDDDRPLATLALGAAQALTSLPAGTGAEWRREVWASVGVLRDDLSSTVLALGLPGDPATATGRALGAWREAGQPAVLTLRQLVRDPPRASLSDTVVSVCENPVVVSTAADRLGSDCTPLVCTSGQPGTAVIQLLRLAVAAGATLRYHGDFDWGGLRIGNVLVDRLPAWPWRYDAVAYRRLVAAGLGRELAGEPVTAGWDPELTREMTRSRRRIDEELVLDDLLADLATAGSPRRSSPASDSA
ncbi:MAG TPA: TIGR02679 family protein [Mycobacteriales bacterium]|nr:TIGR02679 family protein [Mycobacteriales bacterium]